MKRGSKGSEQSRGAVQVASATAAAAAVSGKSKLVFGLGSRTNRVKHDEYAERRSAAAAGQPSEQSSAKQQSVISESESATTSNRLATVSSREKSPLRRRKSLERESSLHAESAAAAARDSEASKRKEVPQVRASKYGNFYKPQDLVSKTPVVAAVAPSTVIVAGDKLGAGSRQPSTSSSSSTTKRSVPTDSATADEVPASNRRRSRSPASRVTTGEQHRSPDRAESLAKNKQATSGAGTRKKEPQIQAVTSSMKEVSNGSPSSTATTTPSPGAGVSVDKAVVGLEKQPPANRTQFNIPPPPQMSSNLAKGSVVSYAKSRIYDKPARHFLGANGTNGSLLDSSTIPASILSGFKPPKQVNVSKARERWEGGEPFAKCKSRLRLTRQDAIKSIPGAGWSIHRGSSVVAAQQMQLQQIMSSNSNSAAGNKETSVKILTRGSVLERVQQFERVPSDGNSSPGSSDSSGSSATSDCEDLVLVIDNDTPRSDHQSVTEAGLALSQPLEPVELRGGFDGGQQEGLATGKVSYKSRVSSIQTSSDPLAKSTLTSQAQSPKSPQTPPPLNLLNRQRFGIVRRRSSAASSAQLIPKFYHPFGKPNTYEIELQKKNIAACFDKFPDRKASLTAPSYKRHFHSIALACGFSEYFKEPLYLYVKHQMTQSNLLHSPIKLASTRHQRSSGVGPEMTNGTGGSVVNGSCDKASIPSTVAAASGRGKPMVRAASIDNSTMEKIQNQTFISCDQFLVCWRKVIATAFDNPARFVHLLTFGERNYLLPDDFVPMIQSIIEDHPGLKFLRAAPDFHMRYIQTVIARIYFNINKSWTGKLSLTELRKSNLLAVLQVLSQEDDINQITDYFSYEHFYVIYCKFWSLDQDHDLLISKEDLARHNDAAISSLIIERIFMGIVSKQIQKTGKMSYSDFVWFLIAEEDKKHPRSIEYWFRLMDIDGDGYISIYEMEYFYYEQKKRLEVMNIEALPFNDTACQILDLVNPKEKNKISLADLKRTRMSTIFFDTFINLEKYLEHESREFVSTRDVVQDGVVISDWDRYASEEYESLVTEESTV